MRQVVQAANRVFRKWGAAKNQQSFFRRFTPPAYRPFASLLGPYPLSLFHVIPDPGQIIPYTEHELHTALLSFLFDTPAPRLAFSVPGDFRRLYIDFVLAPLSSPMLFKSLLSTAVLALLASRVVADLPTIEIIGNKFYYSNNGSQFLMKGVAYQQDTQNVTSDELFVDPLADATACARDIPYLEELSTNVIRVYALNTSQDHSECMLLLEEAGIYVIADLSQPDESIDRSDPQWNTELLARYTSVVDLFHNYTNILGFFAGNEVTNEASNTDASAFVKAAVRDTKAYIKEKGYRTIPVGYSANDDESIRLPLAEYFACGDEEDRADFFGINMYEWCGTSTFKTSGYSTITTEYENLGIPIFFSEYGCNKVQPRKFTEVQAIYSEEMTDIWSGGIVYLYFEELNNYGLVSVIDSTSVSTLTDFKNLKSQLASITPSYATANTAASASQSVTTCPTIGADWAATTVLPPTPDASVCACMNKANACVVDSSVDSADYSDLFSYVCNEVDCSGINGNGTTGDYGAYSGCDAKQKLNFALNLYYEASGSDASACDFSGSATTQSPATASSCKAVLSSAGVSGLGTVSGDVANAASATTDATTDATSGSGSTSGSSSSSTSTGKSSGASSVSGSGASFVLVAISCAALGFGLIMA